jgi:hypothetical protein
MTCHSLQVAFLMDGTAVKSAFALLSTKVTKEGLRPDTSRTTNVREGSIGNRRIRRIVNRISNIRHEITKIVILTDKKKGLCIGENDKRHDG